MIGLIDLEILDEIEKFTDQIMIEKTITDMKIQNLFLVSKFRKYEIKK